MRDSERAALTPEEELYASLIAQGYLFADAAQLAESLRGDLLQNADVESTNTDRIKRRHNTTNNAR